MNAVKVFEYQGTPIEFEIIDGHVKANATLMAKANNKDMSSIFRTLSWIDFEKAVLEDTGLNSVDLRSTKEGANGGTWIHEELVIEFARRLDPKFSLWCNRKIAELLKTANESSKALTPAEMFLHNAQVMVDHERRIGVVEQKQFATDEKIAEIEAKVTTRPDYFTVMGYASLIKIQMGKQKAQQYGAMASKVCRERGFEIERVGDERYGSVGSYPKQVLIEVFGAFQKNQIRS